MFYDEEYISKIYHLEKDTFFTMADRFFDNLIYAALAGIVINYISYLYFNFQHDNFKLPYYKILFF